jgi:hypothetical protein
MSVFAVVDAEGREAGLFLTTAVAGRFDEKLHLIHLVDSKGHPAGHVNRPLFPPLAIKEALEAANDYAIQHGWRMEATHTNGARL